MLLKMFLLCFLAQLIIYQVGLIPSQYFSVLGKKDFYEFNKVTAIALILIVLNSLVRIIFLIIRGGKDWEDNWNTHKVLF